MYTHAVHTHIPVKLLDCFHLPCLARVELCPAHLLCLCVFMCLLAYYNTHQLL